MDGVDGAVGPVEGVNGVLVVGREPGTLSGEHSGGAAGADVEGGRKAVGIPDRPFAGAGAPAELAAAGAVIDPGGTIPRRAAVPLHV